MAQKVLVNGTAYDLKPSPVLIDGTKYQIGGGRTLVNGTGYDIKLGKSLTWRMNSVVDLSKQINTKIGFVVWEISGNEIVIGEYAPWSNRYQIAVEGTIGTTGVRYAIYTDAGGWEKDVYRTITFDEEPTGDLLTWLEANGTRV